MEVLNEGIKKKLDENITIGRESPKESIKTSQLNNIIIENNKEIKALKESISDMNKKIKSITNQSNLEEIKTGISALKFGMNNSVRLSDFKEVKEMQDDNRFNTKKIKEDFEDFQNYQTASGDIQK